MVNRNYSVVSTATFDSRKMASRMVNRNYSFVSTAIFDFPESGIEFVVLCHRCAAPTQTPEPQKYIGSIEGKRVYVGYIECRKCGLALCFPGEYASTDQLIDAFDQRAAEKAEARKEQDRRARRYELAHDTRTHEDKGRVEKAIRARVKEWATAHGIYGPEFRALRTQVLSFMHYRATPDLDIHDPELQTMGDVRRKLDGLLTMLTSPDPTSSENDKAAKRSWETLTHGG